MFTKASILKNTTHLYILYAVILVALIAGGIVVRSGVLVSEEPFNAQAYVEAIKAEKKPMFETVRDSMKEIIDEGGIQGMIDVNEYALVNNLYGIYQCHVISHMTGHEAIVYYNGDFDKAMSHDTQFCELGYRHGAEAQVALSSGGNFKEELYKICDSIKAKNPGADCFHGAGHAFMGETLNVDEALAMCDDLIDDDHSVVEVTPCYNAVFAELTNLVGGKDGGTGMDYTGGPPMTLDETPLAYCSKFADRYRTQCVFEFSGLGVSEFSTAEEIDVKYRGCSTSQYDAELEMACMRSVSAVRAQHELATNHTIVVPEYIFTLSDELRSAYIFGTGTEMKQYIISGANRDWHELCDQFKTERDKQECSALFSDVL